MNMGKIARDIGDFVRNGRTAEEERMHRMARAFQKARGEDAEEAKIIKEKYGIISLFMRFKMPNGLKKMPLNIKNRGI